MADEGGVAQQFGGAGGTEEPKEGQVRPFCAPAAAQGAP